MRLIPLLDAAVVVVSWAVWVAKLPRWRRASQPAYAWLILAWLTLAVAFTVSHPALAPPLGRVTGTPNLGWLLRAVLLLGSGWATLAFLTYLRPDLSTPRRIRQYSILVAGAIGLLVCLFATAPRQPEASWVYVRHGHHPHIAACLLVYLAAIGLELGAIVRAYWRHASTLAQRPITRTGLRLTATGGMFGLAAVGAYASILAAQHLELRVAPERLATLPRLLAGIGVVCAATGITLPAWHGRLAQWRQDYRDYRSLDPLRRALSDHDAPPARLLPAGLRDRLTARDLSFRIYRRIAQIREGYLVFHVDQQPVHGARDRGLAEGLRGTALEVFVEASRVAAALHNPCHPPDRTNLPEGTAPGGGDLRSETCYLVRVARCFGARMESKHHKNTRAETCAP